MRAFFEKRDHSFGNRCKRLGDTRDLAQKNEDLISPNDMIPAEAKLLLYVLSS